MANGSHLRVSPGCAAWPQCTLAGAWPPPANRTLPARRPGGPGGACPPQPIHPPAPTVPAPPLNKQGLART
eukprot:5269356-Pyramimonas_sp.AAC.1